MATIGSGQYRSYTKVGPYNTKSQRARIECKVCQLFCDRCGKAIAKLRNARISDHMILGKSPADKRLIKAMEKEMAKTAEQSRKKKKGKELGASDFTLDRRPRLLPSPPAKPAPPSYGSLLPPAANKKLPKVFMEEDEEEESEEEEEEEEEESLPDHRASLSGSTSR